MCFSLRYCLLISGGIIENYRYHRFLLKQLPPPTCILCADSGLKHLDRLHLSADIVVGDFDSVDPTVLSVYQAQGGLVAQYPPEKDYSDTELAIETAVRMGYSSILIFGALGARPDHTFTNIQLLSKNAKRGNRLVLANEYSMITTVSNGGCLKIDRQNILWSFLSAATSSQGAATVSDTFCVATISDAHGSTSSDSTASAVSDVSSTAAASSFSDTLLISIFPIGGKAHCVQTKGLKYPIFNLTLPEDYTTGLSNEFIERYAEISVSSGILLVMACRD